MGIYKTPLRYPGGKQKLAGFIREILKINNIDGHYIEPYAGGAGVALELLLKDEIEHVHLNDSYIGIYAFWHSVKYQTESLCRMISMASLNIEEWRRTRDIVRQPLENDLLELGYSIFYQNRCNRSGVLTAGIIGGNDQTGNYKMDARFNRIDLIRRIEAISIYSDKISIYNCDAEEFLEHSLPQNSQNSLIYFDPPYFDMGCKLYSNSYNSGDHTRLAGKIKNLTSHKWILSYDGVAPILELYNSKRHFLYKLQYSAANKYRGDEVFVFSDDIVIPESSKMNNIEEGLLNLVCPF